jgi:hypothetical protein
MTWVNIPIEFFMSDQFRGSDPIERATWLALMGYCHTQENGGRIAGAKNWKDRKWQQVVAVTLLEIGAVCDLWHWDGDDLIVHHYPVEKEQKVKNSRESGKESAMKRWSKPNSIPNRVPNGNGNRSNGKNPYTEPEPEPKPELELELELACARGRERAPAQAPAPTHAREPVDSEAIKALVSRYAKAIGKPAALSFEAVKDVARVLESGEETFESLSGKVDAIIAVLKTQPKSRMRFQYSPARFFAENFWQNAPETFADHDSPDGDTSSNSNPMRVRR